MKTLKFFFVSLFVMLGLAAQAQEVVVYKSDGSIHAFEANQVDSVVYQSVDSTTTYKYYLGETEKVSFTEDDLTNTSTSKTNVTTLSSNKASGEQATTFIWPSSWGIPTIIHGASGKNYTAAWNINDGTINVPSGYNYGWFINTAPVVATFTIIWYR